MTQLIFKYMKMKYWKYLLVLMAVIVSMPAYSQFRLTEKGLVNSKDKKLGYYTIECPGKDAAELFRAVSYFTEARMAGPWTSFTAAEPDAFAVNAFVPGVIADGKRKVRSVYDIDFRIMFNISDGKVMVWMPEIKSMGRMMRFDATENISEETDDGVTVKIGRKFPYSKRLMLFVSEKYVSGGSSQYRPGSSAIYNRHGKLKRRIAKESVEDYFNSFTGSLDRYINTGGN